jgi:hypothetical protein
VRSRKPGRGWIVSPALKSWNSTSAVNTCGGTGNSGARIMLHMVP